MQQLQGRVRPKHHIFGEVHENFGSKKIGETQFTNAAWLVGKKRYEFELKFKQG